MKKRRLLKLLDDLAFYNDKGHIYSRHDQKQVEKKREEYALKIERLIKACPATLIPDALIAAVKSRDVTLDSSYKYVKILEDHTPKGSLQIK
ncbi:MAG: hypothetical protein R3E13_02810 [Alphaproteobacteria bacterium]